MTKIMRAYFLLDYTSLSAIEVEQVVKDFDPKQGYARTPGYTEGAIKILRGEIEPEINSFTVIRGHRAEDLSVGTIAGQFFLSCNAVEVFCKAQVKGLKLRDVSVQTPAG